MQSRGLRRVSRHLALAVTFLTGIPLPIEGEASPSELWRSMAWYPVVGLVMGAFAVVLFAAALVVLPSLVAAAVVVLALEVVARGLHLDGLMDAADGLLSGASRERALEIMKDSRVGAMGVGAAVFCIVLKVAALGSLSGATAAVPLLVGWAAARSLPALAVYIWPYARSNGTGRGFTQERSLGPVILDLAFLAVILILVSGLGASLDTPTGVFVGPAIAAVSMALAFGVLSLAARRLGGLTGDLYGMSIEIVEVAALVVGSALAR